MTNSLRLSNCNVTASATITCYFYLIDLLSFASVSGYSHRHSIRESLHFDIFSEVSSPLMDYYKRDREKHRFIQKSG